jgi:hypothetical protein
MELMVRNLCLQSRRLFQLHSQLLDLTNIKLKQRKTRRLEKELEDESYLLTVRVQL